MSRQQSLRTETRKLLLRNIEYKGKIKLPWVATRFFCGEVLLTEKSSPIEPEKEYESAESGQMC